MNFDYCQSIHSATAEACTREAFEAILDNPQVAATFVLSVSLFFVALHRKIEATEYS